MALPGSEKSKFKRVEKYSSKGEGDSRVKTYRWGCVFILWIICSGFMSVAAADLYRLADLGVISPSEHPFWGELIAGDGLAPQTGIFILDEGIRSLRSSVSAYHFVTDILRGLVLLLLTGIIPFLGWLWTKVRDSVYSNVYINTWTVIICLIMGFYFMSDIRAVEVDLNVDDLVQTPDYYGGALDHIGD